MERNVRELEGNLVQVLHTASNLHLPVDLVTAQLALDPLPAAPGVRRSPSVASITFAVAEHFLVKERDVTGPSQKRRIVLPRQIAMFLCRELTHRSLMDIGSQYGGRDHTTVMHSIRRVEDLARRDHRVQRDLVVLKARILSRA
jgi:chromosomal replication initiator protein